MHVALGVAHCARVRQAAPSAPPSRAGAGEGDGGTGFVTGEAAADGVPRERELGSDGGATDAVALVGTGTAELVGVAGGALASGGEASASVAFDRTSGTSSAIARPAKATTAPPARTPRTSGNVRVRRRSAVDSIVGAFSSAVMPRGAGAPCP